MTGLTFLSYHYCQDINLTILGQDFLEFINNHPKCGNYSIPEKTLPSVTQGFYSFLATGLFTSLNDYTKKFSNGLIATTSMGGINFGIVYFGQDYIGAENPVQPATIGASLNFLYYGSMNWNPSRKLIEKITLQN